MTDSAVSMLHHHQHHHQEEEQQQQFSPTPTSSPPSTQQQHQQQHHHNNHCHHQQQQQQQQHAAAASTPPVFSASTPFASTSPFWNPSYASYWTFPSDHLPIGAKLCFCCSDQLVDTTIIRIASWNILNTNFIHYIYENEQGLAGSAITTTNRFSVEYPQITIREERVIGFIYSLLWEQNQSIVCLQEVGIPVLEYLADFEGIGIVSPTDNRWLRDQCVILYREDMVTLFQVICTHCPWYGGEEELGNYLTQYENSAMPMICLGDMNHTAKQMQEVIPKSMTQLSTYNSHINVSLKKCDYDNMIYGGETEFVKFSPQSHEEVSIDLDFVRSYNFLLSE